MDNQILELLEITGSDEVEINYWKNDFLPFLKESRKIQLIVMLENQAKKIKISNKGIKDNTNDKTKAEMIEFITK